MRALAAALAGIAVAVLPATTVLAAEPKPDIAVTSAADKASYAVGETIVITVTVQNKSTVDAKGVRYTGGDSEGVEGVAYGVLSTGFDLAAGATRTVELTGRTSSRGGQLGGGYVAFALAADNGEANDADNTTIVRFRVPGLFADISGYVYEGKTADTGWTPQAPGVPGVRVVATTMDGKVRHGDAVTDAKGMYRLARLPVGEILLTFTAPAGWKIMTGANGEQNSTSVQLVADDDEEHPINVAAKKVTVTSPSATPSASATSTPSGPTTSPSASGTAAPGVPTTSPSPTATTAPGLPITGDNTMLLVGAGVAALAAGGTLVLLTRRRRVDLQA